MRAHRNHPPHSLGVIALIALVVAGCSSESEDGPPPEAGVAATEGAVEERAMMPPDTTDAAVWSHLQAADYESWDLWPGTARLYEGEEPHGMLLTTYVNRTAAGALGRDLPAGAIVVKENYTPDSTLAAVTVMMKVDGYNPDHANWLFGKFQPDGGVDAFGRVGGCQTCHSGADGGDYLFNAVSP